MFSDDAKIVSQSGRLEGEWPKIVQRPARKKVGNGRDESHRCGAYPRASDDKVRLLREKRKLNVSSMSIKV